MTIWSLFKLFVFGMTIGWPTAVSVLLCKIPQFVSKSFRTVVVSHFIPLSLCDLSAIKTCRHCLEVFSGSASEEYGALAVLFSALTVLQSLNISASSACFKTVISPLPSWSGSDGLDADWVTVLQVMSRLQSLISDSSAAVTPTFTCFGTCLVLPSNTLVFGYVCSLVDDMATDLAAKSVVQHKHTLS